MFYRKKSNTRNSLNKSLYYNVAKCLLQEMSVIYQRYSTVLSYFTSKLTRLKNTVENEGTLMLRHEEQNILSQQLTTNNTVKTV